MRLKGLSCVGCGRCELEIGLMFLSVLRSLVVQCGLGVSAEALYVSNCLTLLLKKKKKANKNPTKIFKKRPEDILTVAELLNPLKINVIA